MRPLRPLRTLRPFWSLLAVSLLSTAGAALLVWGGASGPQGAAGRQLLAVLAATGLGGAAVLWVLLDRRLQAVSLPAVLALGLWLRLVALQAGPLLEDDHFRYLWDGMRTATGLDPYRLAPAAFFADPTWAPHWQAVLSGINNPDLPTIYGPVLQWLFAAAHALTPARLPGLLGILLVLDMALLALMARMGAPRRALLVYALHPLVLKESIASAHPDAVLALLLLLALLAWQRQRAWTLGLVLGAALCAKVAALVLLPVLCLPSRGTLFAWSWRVVWACSLTVGLLYLPFWWAGGSDAVALGAFARDWRFNPLLYRLVEGLVPASAARAWAAAFILGAIAVLVWRWRTTRPGAPPPLDAALLWLLLFSPVLNPWYWLWVLPLALLRGQGWLAAAVLAAPLAHLNSAVLAEAGVTLFTLPAGPYTVIDSAWAVQLGALGLAWRFRQRLAL